MTHKITRQAPPPSGLQHDLSLRNPGEATKSDAPLRLVAKADIAPLDKENAKAD